MHLYWRWLAWAVASTAGHLVVLLCCPGQPAAALSLTETEWDPQVPCSLGQETETLLKLLSARAQKPGELPGSRQHPRGQERTSSLQGGGCGLEKRRKGQLWLHKDSFTAGLTRGGGLLLLTIVLKQQNSQGLKEVLWLCLSPCHQTVATPKKNKASRHAVSLQP